NRARYAAPRPSLPHPPGPPQSRHTARQIRQPIEDRERKHGLDVPVLGLDRDRGGQRPRNGREESAPRPRVVATGDRSALQADDEPPEADPLPHARVDAGHQTAPIRTPISHATSTPMDTLPRATPARRAVSARANRAVTRASGAPTMALIAVI